MPQIVDHIHTWVKWKKFFGELHFKCDHPECFLTAPKSKIVGKRTTCASCHVEEFTLTPRHLKMSRPRCINCSQSKEAKEKRELQGKLKDVLNLALEGDQNDERESSSTTE